MKWKTGLFGPRPISISATKNDRIAYLFDHDLKSEKLGLGTKLNKHRAFESIHT